jgi:hypothetical protein
MSSAAGQRMVILPINNNQSMHGAHDAGCAKPMCTGLENAGIA